MLKVLYIIAIGLLFAGFVGFGVATFYQSPTAPTAPINVGIDKTADTQFQQDQRDYETQISRYTRNLSVILLAASVIVIILSIYGLGKIEIIGDGVTLGGVILLFAGTIASFGANDAAYRFIAVTVGLAIIIFLTYWKFIRQIPAATI